MFTNPIKKTWKFTVYKNREFIRVGREVSQVRTRSATCISPSWCQRVEEQGSQSSRCLVGAVAPSSTVALRRQLRENSLGCLVMLDDHLGGYLREYVLTAWLCLQIQGFTVQTRLASDSRSCWDDRPVPSSHLAQVLDGYAWTNCHFLFQMTEY